MIHRYRDPILMLAAAVTLPLFLAVPAYGQPRPDVRYDVLVYEPVEGLLLVSSRARALSEADIVAGDSSGAMESRATRWGLDGTPFAFETLTRAMAEANDINEDHYAVGLAWRYSDDFRAALWDADGAITQLGSLFADGEARAINNLGEMVGWSSTPTSPARAVVWWLDDPQAFPFDIGALAGTDGATAMAYDLNDLGQIVGGSESTDGSEGFHAFLYQDGLMAALPELYDGYGSEAFSINENSQIVGYCAATDPQEGPTYGALWEEGTVIDLGALFPLGYTYALAINNLGQIVGQAYEDPYTGNDSVRAIIWDEGVPVDLNDLIPADAGIELLAAYDINDHGRIVGVGSRLADGLYRAFVLVPRSAPPPVGACCLPDERCVVATEEDCLASAGSYEGDGTRCFVVSCFSSPPPEITAVHFSASSAVNCASSAVTATIEGSALATGATVVLRKAGQHDLPASWVVIEDDTLAVAGFDLGGVYPASWRLVLSNPDGQSAASVETLDVESCPYPRQYTIADLGCLEYVDGTGLGSLANSINEHGDVVGSAKVYGTPGTPDDPPTGSVFHPYLWSDGVMTDLGVVDGPGCGWADHCKGEATDVNNERHAVGWTTQPSGGLGARLWLDYPVGNLPAGLNDLPDLHPGCAEPISRALGINDSLQIVGFSLDNSCIWFNKRPVLWEYNGVNWTVSDLGTLRATDGGVGFAYDINELGQVAGQASTDMGNLNACLWLPEPAYGLPAGPNNLTAGQLGDVLTVAYAINDHGEVVGNVGFVFPFIWLPEPAYGLPAGVSVIDVYASGSGIWGVTPMDINNHGQIVGAAWVVEPIEPWHYAAAIWEDGQWRLLRDVLPPVSEDEWDVFDAGWWEGAINDAGQITGDGGWGGFTGNEFVSHAFLLSPRKHGDLDWDGDVDLDDFATFADCINGPQVPPAPGCDDADLGGDGDVDLKDFASFQEVFTGSLP